MRRMIVLTMIAISLSLLMVSISFAADSSIKVTINGNPIKFTEQTGYPFEDSAGRIQVPLRQTMEELGCMVSWEENLMDKKATLSKGFKAVTFRIGDRAIEERNFYLEQGAYKSEQWYSPIKSMNDTAPLIVSNRTYLPIRAAAERFGASVGWDNKIKTVLITTKQAPVNYSKLATDTSTMKVHYELLQYLGESQEKLKNAFGNVDKQYVFGGGLGLVYTGADGMFLFAIGYNSTNEEFVPEDPCVGFEGQVNTIIDQIDHTIYKTDLERIIGRSANFHFETDDAGEGRAPAFYVIQLPEYSCSLWIYCGFDGSIKPDAGISVQRNK